MLASRSPASGLRAHRLHGVASRRENRASERKKSDEQEEGASDGDEDGSSGQQAEKKRAGWSTGASIRRQAFRPAWTWRSASLPTATAKRKPRGLRASRSTAALPTLQTITLRSENALKPERRGAFPIGNAPLFHAESMRRVSSSGQFLAAADTRALKSLSASGRSCESISGCHCTASMKRFVGSLKDSMMPSFVDRPLRTSPFPSFFTA